MVEVVAGLIHVGDKILIAKRTYGLELSKDKWEFPGGKVNENESDSDALIREIMEEMKLSISVGKYLGEDFQECPERTIHMKLYECNSLSDSIIINDEHSDYKLVDMKDIEKFDLVPADRRLYNLVLGEDLNE